MRDVYPFCGGARECERRMHHLDSGFIRRTREPQPSAALVAARERNEATARAAAERAKAR